VEEYSRIALVDNAERLDRDLREIIIRRRPDLVGKTALEIECILAAEVLSKKVSPNNG
jgi:hypothetical protein